jgi:hypothetical protein
MLKDQDKPVVVSTLGSYLTPEAANILKDLTFPEIVQPSLFDFFLLCSIRLYQYDSE